MATAQDGMACASMTDAEANAGWGGGGMGMAGSFGGSSALEQAGLAGPAGAALAGAVPLTGVMGKSALEHLAEAGRDAKKLKRGPPPEAPSTWTWAPPYAPHGEAVATVAEAATEAAPYELPAWPFAPLAPPATANTRAAAAELIHNIGWPVPPGLFLNQHGSRKW